MSSYPTICDAQWIERFLDHQLTEEQEDAFEQHLNDCVVCRDKLESVAASDEIWMGLRESLVHVLKDELDSREQPETSVGLEQVISRQSILELLAPTDDERMLGRLGPYEVVGIVGAGGMGVVLKALDPSLNRYVAIKVLAPHLRVSGAARRRFSREAQAAAAVVHDNVIEIHGVSEMSGVPYFVMRYVRGPSLQKRLDDNGPLAPTEVLRIGMQAARGLAAAHSQGLVHRDVKPANILLADGVERVKLTDFGLARAADDASLTQTGYIAGTPQYMSPEQARGETVDERSDLFSLGSVMYAMCTGRAPFRADTSYGVLRRITDDAPRAVRDINPDIPEWLGEIVDRLMEKHAEDRYRSAQEVADLLEQCLAHVQQPATTPLPESLRKTSPSGVISFFTSKKGILTMVTFTMALLGAIAISATSPPQIAGNWHGEGWGNVVLEESKPGTYEGTYKDAQSEKPGTIQLKWSRVERRYNGKWSDEQDRFGSMSIRPVGDDIRGAWTTSRESGTNPETPALADLQWERGHTRSVDTRQPTRDRTGQALEFYESKQARRANLMARRFLTAVYAGDKDAAVKWVDQTNPNMVKSMTQENIDSLRAIYAGNPNAITRLGPTRLVDEWAAVYIAPLDSQSDYTVGIVLRDTPEGWRVYHVDDYSRDDRLADFLRRHWGVEFKKVGEMNVAKQKYKDQQRLSEARLVARGFFKAVQEEKMDKAKDFVDQESPAFLESLTNEDFESLRQMYARNPKWTSSYGAGYVEGDWAVTYLSPPDSRGPLTVGIVLRDTPDGWRVYHIDDFFTDTRLSDFLHRHWSRGDSKKADGANDATQDGEDEQQMRDVALVMLGFLTALQNEELDKAKGFLDLENQVFEKGLRKENIDAIWKQTIREPKALPRIGTVHVEGDWAATYLEPASAEDTRTVAFVLRRTSNGWRIRYTSGYNPASRPITDFLAPYREGDSKKEVGFVPVVSQPLAEAIDEVIKTVRGEKEKGAWGRVSDQDLEVIQACQGFEKSRIDHLEVGKDAAFCVTTPVKNEQGQLLVAEMMFGRRSQGTWNLVMFDVEPADEVERDIAKFRGRWRDAEQMVMPSGSDDEIPSRFRFLRGESGSSAIQSSEELTPASAP